MSGLPRDLIKWLQSLDLTHPIRNVKRDFSNGYLVAEIFVWYYPHDMEMHSFVNGNSLQVKQSNWQLLEKFFIKEKLDIPKELIEGTIHCKPRAAIQLLERVYTVLTLKELKYLPSKNSSNDFTDTVYQLQLPPHARSTTTQSIKTNLANTELNPSIDCVSSALKTLAIIDVYQEQKRKHKELNPG
jgi:hypothetical protein